MKVFLKNSTPSDVSLFWNKIPEDLELSLMNFLTNLKIVVKSSENFCENVEVAEGRCFQIKIYNNSR